MTPAEYLGLETPWGRWQVDQVALLAGRQAERDANNGKQTAASRGYRSVKTSGARIKKVDFRKLGIR